MLATGCLIYLAGVKVMFRVALLLFRSVLGKQDQLVDCPSLYETVEKLRKIPSEFMEEEFLVREVRECF